MDDFNTYDTVLFKPTAEPAQKAKVVGVTHGDPSIYDIVLLDDPEWGVIRAVPAAVLLPLNP